MDSERNPKRLRPQESPSAKVPNFVPLLQGPQDIDLTERLKAAGELLGIQILDHVIVTDTSTQAPEFRAVFMGYPV